MTLQQHLADYILALKDAAAHTRHAADRPVYESYLADAAVLLALATTDAPAAAVHSAIADHERRRGQTWLADDSRDTPDAAWQAVKAAL